MTSPKKKPVGVWIALLVLPFALLFLTAVLQFFVQFGIAHNTEPTTAVDTTLQADGSEAINTTSTQSTTSKAANIMSVLIGIGSGMMILVGTPIWITMLVLAINHNKKVAAALYQHPVNNTPPHAHV